MAAPVPELRFGRFTLRPATRELLEGETRLRLGARAFDLLLALAEARGEVVSRETLFERAWPGRVVLDDNLKVQIMALRKLLGAQTIATVPGRGYQFMARLDDDLEAPLPPPATSVHASGGEARSTNLPAHLSEMLGRAQELAVARSLLREHAVVTIAGSAGIGKTTLALHLAQQVRGEFADGAWLIELAAISDPGQAAPLVARSLGIVEQDEPVALATIAAALRSQSMLLVLDNCEHVLDAVVALVDAVTRAAPKVRILATSQEVLKLGAERVLRLAPLAVADADPEAAAQSGAVQLFVARAQAADRGFALTKDNLATVVDICRRLDGLPLAIELAAGRLPLLGIEGIRARLSERFRVLTGGARFAPRRQQTLRAAFEWSHDLLTVPEQTVFRRLAVFVGGFSLELAQRVAADDHIDAWAVLDHLGVLVDKSLVIIEGRDTPRYRLLETGRAFALEQLDRACETDALLSRHAQALRALMQAFDAAVAREPRFDMLVRRIAPELDNLHAALHRATGASGDRETAIALCASADWLWNELAQPREGWHWCRLIRPRIDASTPPTLSARFGLAAAGLGRTSLQPAREWVEDLRRAAADFRVLGDTVGLYRSLCLLGGPSDGLIAHGEARRHLDEAECIEDPSWSPRLRLRRQASLEWWLDLDGQLERARMAGRQHVALARASGGVAEVNALSNLADTELALGNADEAIALCQASIARAAELGRPAAALHTYENLVPALLARGDLGRAWEAIRTGRATSVRGIGTAFMLLIHAAALSHQRGDGRLAAQLIGCTDRTHAEGSRLMHPPERRVRDQLLEQLRLVLTEHELVELQREGATWSEDEAFARMSSSWDR
jgi:predicted ATPase/DNA-binding winged helix-turn-helix (wHTH) protein